MNTFPSTRQWLRTQLAEVIGRIQARSSSNAAEALFHLNRSLLTYGNEEWVHEMKAAFINHHLASTPLRHKHLITYFLVKQVLECWDCEGTGHHYSEGCQKCCGTGIWRSTQLLKVWMSFGKQIYCWHLPLDRVQTFLGPEPVEEKEWRGTKERHPHPGKFKEAIYLATLYHWLKRAGHNVYKPRPRPQTLKHAWNWDRMEDDIPF